MKQKIADTQVELKKNQIDGWLFYDFRRSNDLACQFLNISNETLLTRRYFYWIPSEGEPVKIVSSIEDPLKHLPGQTKKFKSWQQLEEILKETLRNSKRVAMEYSPRNAIPYISKVDAGTVELIREFGVEVVSSSDLLQKYSSMLTENQLEMHLVAADVLDKTANKTWNWIFENIKKGTRIDEYQVQQFILNEIKSHKCLTQDLPICAVNANSADPHFSPDKLNSSEIKPGDFILIDLWCKLDEKEAVYADITRVGVAAERSTLKQQEIFSIVQQAQQAATELVKQRYGQGKPLQGWEVDQAARDVIESAGYGDFFVHRTGHNIGISDHGNGAHMDNFETKDLRYLLPQTCFSIEPGIYLPGEFGVRLEYDVYLGKEGEVLVTGGIQDQLVCFNDFSN
jgi:Xaa-Pro aminopeptidase